jgi:hypothetical protein
MGGRSPKPETSTKSRTIVIDLSEMRRLGVIRCGIHYWPHSKLSHLMLVRSIQFVAIHKLCAIEIRPSQRRLLFSGGRRARLAFMDEIGARARIGIGTKGSTWQAKQEVGRRDKFREDRKFEGLVGALTKQGPGQRQRDGLEMRDDQRVEEQ